MTQGRRNILIIAILLLTVGCAATLRPEQIIRPSPPAHLATLVDSEPAHRLLTELLERRPPPDARVATLTPSSQGTDLVTGWSQSQRPDQARLLDLARKVSLDFAALTFAREAGADDTSRAVRAAFERFLDDGANTSREVLTAPGGFPYTVLFAPSWLYRSHPETGADLAHARKLIARLGLDGRLIETGQSASVEANAAVIAETVRMAGREGKRVILVSASKSGAEVAFALTRVLSPEEGAPVAAWINIVGALGGSPLADRALRAPASWFTGLVLWFGGWSWDGLTSLATGPSRKRLEGATMPDSIAVVNVIAVPVTGSVGPEVFFGYQVLREHGPNDGVVLLADTVWPGGANIVTLGPDHLYTPRSDEGHTMALLRAVDFAVRLHGAALPSSMAIDALQYEQRLGSGGLDTP